MCAGPAESPERWGWELRERRETLPRTNTDRAVSEESDEPNFRVVEYYVQHGKRIGWCDGIYVFLDPGASLAEAQRITRDCGERLAVNSETLGKVLFAKGLLEDREEKRGRYTKRKNIVCGRRGVYVLAANNVVPPVNLAGDWADPDSGCPPPAELLDA